MQDEFYAIIIQLVIRFFVFAFNGNSVIVVFLFVYCLLLCCVEELQHFVYFVSYFCEIFFFVLENLSL